ncbi:MAG: DUF4097 domain-containing protein [Ruminococcus sp.]|nr:DUF4097 domain-containing protein [Ruminococcus sp.]
MKTSAKVLSLLTVMAMAASFTSCVSMNNIYSHAEEYTAGDREISDVIESVDINWNSGSVTVTTYDKDTVSVVEKCSAELKESQQVHTWVDGKTLHVQYCKSGENVSLKNAQKDLEIKIPKSFELDDIVYDGASGASTFENITASTIDLDTASGNIMLTNCSADSFVVDTASGDVIIEQTGEASSMNLNAASGSISITADSADDFDIDTASGDIYLNVKSSNTVKIDSASGKNELHFGTFPSDISIDTASGDVNLFIPEKSDFTLNIDTASGDLNSDISFTKEKGKYIFGNGTNNMSVDTASGDVTIKSEE